ncbi:uncharacterized protein LOC128846907 isoform X2 [Malaclemys terrapin pileata]|uniref:uncharacterized protein LOC128846907 isoform X2 n=1 Tax=Malaclemys terrapin pileata TaxID=2991368 RepID=UPI0023A825B0|nr:uncharacterized protein LOC128846907 isoform X2 [Malaclemys terrapin pileata]
MGGCHGAGQGRGAGVCVLPTFPTGGAMQTALHWAAKHGKEDLVSLLVAAGADVNTRSLPMLGPSTATPHYTLLLCMDTTRSWTCSSAATVPSRTCGITVGTWPDTTWEQRSRWTELPRCPVTAVYNLQPLLLPGPVLCAPCFGQGLPAELSRARAATSRESTSALKAWLGQHLRNPYPSKGEKVMLAIISKMSLPQVSTWFANARRRLRKEKRLRWAPRSKWDRDASEGEAECEQQQGEGPGGSPKGVSPGPCLESEHQRPSPKPNAAGLTPETQPQQPKRWCLAETATCPRQEQSSCLRLEVAPPGWGLGAPGGATYVLSPQLSLALPWRTESHRTPPL